MRFKINDIDNEQFYQIPKILFTSDFYKNLGSDARIIYALLKDRMHLSRKSGWKEENGDIYLLFKQEEICELLDVSLSTVARAMKKLQSYNLIEVIRQGLSKPNKIYINKTRTDDRQIKTSQIDESEQVNLTIQDKSNLLTSNTDISNTDISNTEKSIRTRQRKENFAEFVTMTNDEYSSLIERLGSEEAVRECIQILDNYKGSTGKTYKSDYRTILNWVIDKYREKRRKSPNGEIPKGIRGLMDLVGDDD